MAGVYVISLYFLCCSVNGSVCLVCFRPTITILLGVVVILLLIVGGGALLD